MNHLRHVWQSPGDTPRRAALLVAAALCGAVATPLAQAAPHAHARRPLPTHLHSTAIESGSVRGSRSGRSSAGAGKAKPGAHGSATKARTGDLAQGRVSKKGARRKSDAADEAVPLLRTHSHAAGHGHASAHEALLREQDTPKRTRRGLRGKSHLETAASEPVSHASSRGLGQTVHGATSPLRSSAVRVPAARAVIATENDRGDHYVAPHASRAGSAAVAYAEGVSRPDDDETLAPAKGRDLVGSRTPDAGTGHGVEVPLVGRAYAGPAAAPVTRTSPVVQGFGGELAMAPTDTGVRPGGTRRRGHPATYVPQSYAAAPEALEEREDITSAAVSPAVLPLTYDRDGRLMVPAPMRGSKLILAHQNQMATADGLERVQDDADLDRLRAAHSLISFPSTDALHVNDELPWNRRCARPWAVAFANDMAQAYYMHFHQPLTVTSAVRTVRYQARLQMVNGNAAAISGDLASPHLTGQAIDFAKRGMATAELAWMRGYLTPLMQAGKIDVEEEFQQACFHISIYRSYLAGRHVAPSRALAQAREIGSGNSAAANPASVTAPLESGVPSTPAAALPPADH